MSSPAPEQTREALPARVALVLPACVLLPLVGAVAAGTRPDALFAFPPPVDIPTDYPRFSGWAVAAVLLLVGSVAASWIVTADRRIRNRTTARPATVASAATFPWWGWAAAGWTLVWWVLAWNRFPWFAPVQRYTFAPLWLGFVVAMNALAFARTGTCLMTRATARWLLLFVASAVFWWVFEWLNRFVENWHYPIMAVVGPREYFVHATASFATVLPAVAAVREVLGTMPALQSTLAAGPGWPWTRGRPATAAVLLAAGAAGLTLTGVWPLHLYPALWAAPLLLGVGLAMTAGTPGWWNDVARGDWRDAGSWALAGIVCGFFWELWNVHSLARWIYTVPFVDCWHVFEMPALGYTGYLPFGLECGLAVAAILGGRALAVDGAAR